MRNTKLIGLTAIFMLSINAIFGQLEWVPYEGEMPGYAVMGGVEGNETLAVCRCNFKGALHPGKMIDDVCSIGYDGEEISMASFEILVNNGVVDLDWQKSEGLLPDHAVRAGIENGKNIYIGRISYEYGTHPGKVFQVGGGYMCNIGYEGEEVSQKTFEVLVENHSKQTTDKKEDERCSGPSDQIIAIGKHIGTIPKNGELIEGTSLLSNNLKYQCRVTDDGRLVIEEISDHAICDDGRIMVFATKETWSNTSAKGDAAKEYYIKLQEDGNLCVYAGKEEFVWCSRSNGKDGHHLELTEIGDIEIVNSHGVEVWPD